MSMDTSGGFACFAYYREKEKAKGKAMKSSFMGQGRSLLLLLSFAMLCVANASVAAPFTTIIDNSGIGNPDENVLFNKAGQVTVGNVGNSYTIQGATNQTQVVIDIVSPQHIALAGVGGVGQATISTVAPLEYFGAVQIFPHTADDLPSGLNPLGGITDIEFNIDVDVDGKLGIVVNGMHGDDVFQEFETYDLDANGQNKFRITAAFPDVIITSVELISYNTSGNPENLFKELFQIRISGGTATSPDNDPGGDPDPVHTPEPASLILWTAIAAGLGYRWQRARKI
jgi:hypothetical protein